MKLNAFIIPLLAAFFIFTTYESVRGESLFANASIRFVQAAETLEASNHQVKQKAKALGIKASNDFTEISRKSQMFAISGIFQGVEGVVSIQKGKKVLDIKHHQDGGTHYFVTPVVTGLSEAEKQNVQIVLACN